MLIRHSEVYHLIYEHILHDQYNWALSPDPDGIDQNAQLIGKPDNLARKVGQARQKNDERELLETRIITQHPKVLIWKQASEFR